MADPDLGVFGRNKSFNDYQRLNDEFMQRKALQQAQIQQAQAQAYKAMRPEEITPYQAASLELQKQRLRMAAGGVSTVDENGNVFIQPQRKLSATEQKDFSKQSDDLKNLDNALGAFEQLKAYQGKPMYSGFGAEMLADANAVPVIGSFIDDEKATNTRGYQNLVKQGQFSQLKATFPGQISNAERTALESLGALASYTPDQQREILANAEAALKRNRDLTASRASDIATGNQYAKASTGSSAPKIVTTQAQFDALPSGAIYMEDDGKTYRKP